MHISRKDMEAIISCPEITNLPRHNPCHSLIMRYIKEDRLTVSDDTLLYLCSIPNSASYSLWFKSILEIIWKIDMRPHHIKKCAPAMFQKQVWKNYSIAHVLAMKSIESVPWNTCMSSADEAWSVNAALLFPMLSSNSEMSHVLRSYMSAKWMTAMGAHNPKNKSILKNYPVIKEPVRFWMKSIADKTSDWNTFQPWWEHIQNYGMHRVILDIYTFLLEKNPKEYQSYIKRHGILSVIQDARVTDALHLLDASASMLQEKNLRDLTEYKHHEVRIWALQMMQSKNMELPFQTKYPLSKGEETFWRQWMERQAYSNEENIDSL